MIEPASTAITSLRRARQQQEAEPQPLLTPPPRPNPTPQPGDITLQTATGQQTTVPRPQPSPTTGQPMLQPPQTGGSMASSVPSPVAPNPTTTPPTPNARPAQPAPSPVAAPPVAPDGKAQYSTTTGISVRATPEEAKHFGANADKPADLRPLYNALESFNATMPNYGRDPQKVVAALRSSDPQLQAMAREAVLQLEPDAAFDLLSDAEFEAIYGLPKSATRFGVRRAQEESLRRTGRSLVGVPYEQGAFIASTPGGGAFENAADYFARLGQRTGQTFNVADDYQTMVAQLLGGGGSPVTGGPMLASAGGGSTFAGAPGPEGFTAPGSYQAMLAPMAGGGTRLAPITGNESPMAILPGGGGGPLEGELMSEALRQLRNPSVYDDELMQRGIEQARREAARFFDEGDEMLRAELASRGIEYGGIAKGRYADLFADRQQRFQDMLLPLLRERATSIGGAREAAFNNALRLSEFGDSRARADRAELRGERSYQDALADKARDQALQEYLLGRDERRYNDETYQDLLWRALMYGQGGAGISALGGAGSIYGQGSNRAGGEAEGLNADLAAFLEMLFRNRAAGSA